MARTNTVPLDWAEKLRSHVYQAKLSAVTSDFAYFHASRAHYYSANGVEDAASLQAAKIDPTEGNKLKELNVTSAKTNEAAMAEFEQKIKDTKIDKSQPLDVQKVSFRKRIVDAGDAAKKEVTERIDHCTEEAIRRIENSPEGAQNALTDLYITGLQIVTGCFEYLVKKIEEAFKYIVDFLNGVWDTLVRAYNAVKVWVDGAVQIIRGQSVSFFAFAQSNGIGGVDVSDATQAYQSGIGGVDVSDATQATQFLVSLVYSFRIPDSEIVASTNRIWDEYKARYSEATTTQEPQSVTVSRKPKPEGDRDTDGKLMFISWQADGAGSSNGRELMERVCQSEQKALAGSYSGGLRYNIVDLENLQKAVQQTLGVGNKREIGLQSRRREVQY